MSSVSASGQNANPVHLNTMGMMEQFQSYTSSMQRLESFLEEVLKKDLDRVMRERDEIYQKIADGNQLNRLLADIKRNAGGVDLEEDPRSVTDNAGKPLTTEQKNELVRAGPKRTWRPMQEVEMLSDVGCNFYMQCRLKDPAIVHLNIGAGVILAMTHEECARFLVKKEVQLRAAAESKTKEAIRLRYRIRVVMEAITRLYDAQMALGRPGGPSSGTPQS